MLELDELWSFVYRKGDKVWVWLALCRETRQVVAFVMGDRSGATCERLWRAIPESYKGRQPGYSDFWEALTGRCSQKSSTRLLLARRKARLPTPREVDQHLASEAFALCVRKTLSFSKSAQMHHCCLKLFIYRYNLERRSIILE